MTSSPGRIIRSEKLRQLGQALGPEETITSSTSSMPGIEYSFSNPKAATWFSVMPGLDEVGDLVVDVVADRADHREGLDLVGALDRPGLHHRGHAVGPADPALLELLDQVDVDEVDPERLVLTPGFLQVVQQRVDELGDLLVGGRADGALDPDIGVADVLLRDPRVVHLEVEADVALLVDDRLLAGGEHDVAQARLEPVPTRGQGRGDIAHVLVVEEEQGPEPVALHRLVGPLAGASSRTLAQLMPSFQSVLSPPNASLIPPHASAELLGQSTLSGISSRTISRNSSSSSKPFFSSDRALTSRRTSSISLGLASSIP